MTNTGGVPATALTPTALAAPFSHKGGAFPGTGSCATSLAAGASCSFFVTFAPSAAAPSASSVGLSYDDGVTAASASVGLAGTGGAPAALAISDGSTYDYQTRATGSTTSHTFTVTNSGGVDATALAPGGVSGAFAFTGSGYPGAGGTCGATLAAGASCTMTVAFAPTTGGLKTATVTLGYGDGVATQSATRPLQGTGAAPATLTLSDTPTFAFGIAANGAVRQHTPFTVTNAGGVAATSLAGLVPPSAPLSRTLGGIYPGYGRRPAAHRLRRGASRARSSSPFSPTARPWRPRAASL